jgi:folate-binding protein YgfZ
LNDETAAFGLLHVWADAPGIMDMMEATDGQMAAAAWLGRRPVYNALDFLLPQSVLENFSHVLAENGAEAVSAEELLALRIVAGIPAVPLDAGPGDLPQEAGLEHDGVSFEKGCYLGQEVMARLHSQGHVNRALWQVAWRGQTKDSGALEPVPLYAGQESAGELRSRVTKDGRGLGLAMLKSRLLVEKKALSLSPGGPEVIELVRSLTAP